jgi:hypothetical protein
MPYVPRPLWLVALASAGCPGDDTGACDPGLVEIDGVCVADACDPDPCAANEVCATTVDGPSCDCADGFARSSAGDCWLDRPDAVELLDHPVSVTVAGVGAFEAHQVSRVGMGWTLQRVAREGGDWPVYDGLAVPPVQLGALTGPDTELDALRTAIAAGDPLDVTLRLEGVAGEWVDVRALADVTAVEAGDVDVGEAVGLAGLTVATSWWEVVGSAELSMALRPEPRPGASFSVPDAGRATWELDPAAAIGLSDRDQTLSGVPDLVAPFLWFVDAKESWDTAAAMDYRRGSSWTIPAAGDWTDERTLTGVIPSGIWFFDPSRPYRSGPLLTMDVAFAHVNPGPCPLGESWLATGDCALDLGPDVADVSERPITVTVFGVGVYQVRQLSSVGNSRPFVRVQTGDYNRAAYSGPEQPAIVTLGGITGSQGSMNALRAQLADPDVYDVTVHLEGLAGQWIDAAASPVRIEVIDDRDLPIGDSVGLAALRLVPEGRWTVAQRNEINPDFQPRPLPGVEVEVDGIDSGWTFAPGVVDVAPGDLARTLPGVPVIDRGVDWFAESSVFFDQEDAHYYRSMSFIHRDADNQETHRYNAYEVLPVAAWLFDADRPYGDAPLVTLDLTFGKVELAR